MDVPMRYRAEKGTSEYWHIAIWYGRDSLPMSPTGLYPANHFGEIESGMAELAEACERIRFEGVRTVAFSLVDG